MPSPSEYMRTPSMTVRERVERWIAEDGGEETEELILLVDDVVDELKRLEALVNGSSARTLRDEIAIAALPLVAAGHCDAHASTVWVRREHCAGLAADALAFADAFLEARRK